MSSSSLACPPHILQKSISLFKRVYFNLSVSPMFRQRRIGSCNVNLVVSFCVLFIHAGGMYTFVTSIYVGTSVH